MNRPVGTEARPWPATFLPGALLAAMVLALLSVSAKAQDEPVTVDGLLSAPFPSDLTAAPVGGGLAWVENDEGIRNIWVAEPPAYEGRQVTSYAEDDGQELGSLTWAPDATGVVYVRGGAPNRQGEHPNPTSDPEGADRDLWWLELDGSGDADAPDPVRIGPGNSPTFAPDRRELAFLRGGEIWLASVEDEADPRRIAEARGSLGSLRWSPEGDRLAFVSHRGTHAFVGVLELEEGRIQWMEPSVDRDSDPVWSPDGERLAFRRTPVSTDLTLFEPVREAEPWSVWTADPESGAAEEVWRADPGTGSSFWGVSAGNQLLWTEGDRIVFPWEGTGWVLLYSIPAEGGEATRLTPGEFEVEQVALGPEARVVYYNSNQDDIDRRHLWRVPADGSAPPEALTEGDGIEWAPTPTSGGEAVAFFRSGGRTPAHAAVLEGPEADVPLDGAGGDGRPLNPDPIPASFPPKEDLVEPEAVTITAADGMEVPAQLFVPPEAGPEERRPAVAFFHGGSRRQMLLGFHYMDYYHHTYALNQYLAARGFVVLSVNFRSGTGYGMEFREAIDYGAAGASEFQDVQGAALYLRERPDVDPDRIGLWGGSYGGYLTALGLARASDLFAAGVDIHGVHDWNVGIETFRPDYNPLEDPEASRVAFEASPMAHLDGWTSPVLVIHGDDDRNVRFLETAMLVEELRERDVHVEQLVFPDEVHGFLLHSNWLSALRATADFLERKLGR